jgi:aryl-alcohol dehydrogenase-like predicted oxidoreductase
LDDRSLALDVKALTGNVQLGMGCARLGEAMSGGSWKDRVLLVRRAVERGVRYFDTADAYGNGASERLLGQALRGRRSEVEIATKGGYLFRQRSAVESRARVHLGPVLRRLGTQVVTATTNHPASYSSQDFSAAYLRKALDASLKRLGTDYVDVYQLHAPRAVQVETLVELGDELVAAGKIRKFGIAIEELDEASSWIDSRQFQVIQLPFGVLQSDARDDLLPAAAEMGKIVIARSVLGGGVLSPRPVDVGGRPTHATHVRSQLEQLARDADASVAQLAMWYVRARDDVGIALVGMRVSPHLDEAVRAFGSAMPDGTVLARLDAIADHRDRG